MKKKVIVLSLGGSLIIPDSVDYSFLEKLKKVLRKNYSKYKFVIVCGGGSIARKYIEALKMDKHSTEELSRAGIRATRMNALFLMQFFGKEANDSLPLDMHEVVSNLKKNSIVICGALRYAPDSTSDSTAAKLAHQIKTEFINLTDVAGLYTKNPKEFKDAKLIKSISWKDFESIAKSIKYSAGQHFVLDQGASTIIKKHKIPTYIVGKNLKELESILKGKNFIGTRISN